MTKLTKLETAILKAIDASEYGEFLEDAIWTFSVWDNIDRTACKNRQSLSGGVSSLTQKGLVRVGGSGKESEIHMTAAGVEALLATGIELNKSKYQPRA